MNCDCICIHTAEESCEDDYSIIGADIVAFESSQLGSISGTLVLLEIEITFFVCCIVFCSK